MTKAVVIGCSAKSKLAEAIIREHENANVVFYDTIEDVPLKDRGLTITECYKFTDIPRFEMPFIPRQPKGHVRPYKYHR